MIESVLAGFENLMTFYNMIAIVLGLICGVFIGCLPGLSPSMAIALATPFTIGLNPITGLSFLLGVYKGGVYGGSISAILIATPGTPEAAATLLDGYPLAKEGKARIALDAALIASVCGDFIGTVLLVLFTPVVASLALKIGPIEMVPLVVLALSVIVFSLGKNKVKGFIAACIGAALTYVGLDPVEGTNRLIFDVYELSDGLSLIPFLVGLFALPEIVFSMIRSRAEHIKKHLAEKNKELEEKKEEFALTNESLSLMQGLKHWRVIVQSAVIGGLIGALPGLGSTAAAFTCYGLAKRTSKNPEMYGKGSIEGIMACETGNNGTCGPALIPMLTLGIPGSSTAAILYGTLLMHGIVPGPRIFIEHGPIIYAVFIGLIVSAFLLYPIGKFCIKHFSAALYKIDSGILFGAIFFLCFTGTYAIHHSFFDVMIMLGAGVLAFMMRLFGFPVSPTLIAFILTPILEKNFRQALVLEGGNVMPLFTSPIAAVLWMCFLGLLLWTPIMQILRPKVEDIEDAEILVKQMENAEISSTEKNILTEEEMLKKEHITDGVVDELIKKKLKF